MTYQSNTELDVLIMQQSIWAVPEVAYTRNSMTALVALIDLRLTGCSESFMELISPDFVFSYPEWEAMSVPELLEEKKKLQRKYTVHMLIHSEIMLGRIVDAAATSDIKLESLVKSKVKELRKVKSIGGKKVERADHDLPF